MMAFGSRLISKLRSKKGEAGVSDGDKTESHNIPSSSNSRSTTPPPPPLVVGAGQKPTIASAQAHPISVDDAGQKSTIESAQVHPISVDEARDELTKSLRSKYHHNGLAQGVTKGQV